ncbi:hypothetical protein ACI799_09315 [Blastococcus sp. SYSU DS0753]
MPLRSVEAATRDDAIAAAREQFGPHVRVVGVRRVRSGGVLGFFATERYVAEVAPDQFVRPGAPSPSTGPTQATPVAAYDSPLASAAPARARTTAPARNGAAAWAAEATRQAPVEPVTSGASSWPTTPAAPAAAAAPAAPADDERIDELAGLLGGSPAGTGTPATPAAPSTGYGRSSASRATFPKATRGAASTPRTQTAPSPAKQPTAARDDAEAAPSPFTAALARMVSGDRDVRQAVEEALAQPAELHPAAQDPVPFTAEAPGTPAPRSSLAAAIRSADPSTRSQAVQQEEFTVRDQATAPPSTSTTGADGLPTWAAPSPEPAAPAPSARQEEIAEALRDALAQGHSDEALAGILRKMLAGDSPREALTEPVQAEPVLPALDLPGAGDAFLPEPVTTTPELVDHEPVRSELPVVEPDPLDTPLFASVGEQPVTSSPPAPALVVPEPVGAVSSFPLFDDPLPPAAPAPTSADLGWGSSAADTALWGEPVLARPVGTDSPIWADVLGGAPTSPAPLEVATVAGEAALVVEDGGAAVVDESPVPAVEDDWVPFAVAEDAVELPAETAAEVVAEASPAEATVAEEVVAADAVAEEALAADAIAAEALGEEAIAADTVAEEVVAEEAIAADAVAEEAIAADAVAEEAIAADAVAEEPLLARTASDPAPLTLSSDATTVMPRVSLLPPLPGARGRGLPPVPPASGRPAVPPSRPAAAGPRDAAAREAEGTRSAPRTLATVTRLPVGPLMGDDHPELAGIDDDAVVHRPVPAARAADVPAAPAPSRRTGLSPAGPREIVARLSELGLPHDLLAADFAGRIEAEGTYAALTRVLAARLPEAPELPTGAGEVLFVVGPGVEALRAARALAVSLRLDPDRVQWATRGDLAGLAPKGSRVTTVDAAIDRQHEATDVGMLTIVAVDAPLRSDFYWMSQMLAIWSPASVWAVAEATRKPEDLEVWLGGLPRVDALVVQDTDLSADPAAVLQRLTVPVALLDGARATPHRWASLLCERLDSPQA